MKRAKRNDASPLARWQALDVLTQNAVIGALDRKSKEHEGGLPRLVDGFWTAARVLSALRGGGR